MMRKIALEVVVTDDHAVRLIEALGDAAEKIWTVIPTADCDLKVLELEEVAETRQVAEAPTVTCLRKKSMCGRYVRRSDKQKIAEYFHASPQPAELPMPGADYNVAPTTFQPIIRQSRESGEREMVLARWGLVPFFTKELSDVKGLSTINARAESITKTPTWREPMKKRRCIVPASAFFEWSKVSPPLKQPYVFELANGSPIGFAGLWDAWKDKDGHWLQSFAIVTTEANELMSRIHPRMPVILHPRDYDRWLDRDETERLPLDLLRPLESDEMEMFEANPKVGNVRNNGPELMRAAAKAAVDGELPL